MPVGREPVWPLTHSLALLCTQPPGTSYMLGGVLGAGERPPPRPTKRLFRRWVRCQLECREMACQARGRGRGASLMTLGQESVSRARFMDQHGVPPPGIRSALCPESLDHSTLECVLQVESNALGVGA